jgi:hypothetical protein
MLRSASAVAACGTLGLALLSPACVTPLEPCSTECSEVAGTYEMVAGETTVESGANHPQLCDSVYYVGATVVVVLEQSGSALRLTGYNAEMAGTLYEDDTLTFNRVNFASTDVGPVTVRISGNFALEGGKKVIKGRMRFDVQDYDCDVWSVLTLTEL